MLKEWSRRSTTAHDPAQRGDGRDTARFDGRAVLGDGEAMDRPVIRQEARPTQFRCRCLLIYSEAPGTIGSSSSNPRTTHCGLRSRNKCPASITLGRQRHCRGLSTPWISRSTYDTQDPLRPSVPAVCLIAHHLPLKRRDHRHSTRHGRITPSTTMENPINEK